jgi:hypothetical protein
MPLGSCSQKKTLVYGYIYIWTSARAVVAEIMPSGPNRNSLTRVPKKARMGAQHLRPPDEEFFSAQNPGFPETPVWLHCPPLQQCAVQLWAACSRPSDGCPNCTVPVSGGQRNRGNQPPKQAAKIGHQNRPPKQAKNSLCCVSPIVCMYVLPRWPRSSVFTPLSFSAFSHFASCALGSLRAWQSPTASPGFRLS